MKKQEEKFKTVTFRLNEKLYQKCVEKTISISTQRGKLVKISELIRELIEKLVYEK